MNTTTHEATTHNPTTQARIRTAITGWLTKHDDAITTCAFVAAVILDLLGRV